VFWARWEGGARRACAPDFGGPVRSFTSGGAFGWDEFVGSGAWQGLRGPQLGGRLLQTGGDGFRTSASREGGNRGGQGGVCFDKLWPFDCGGLGGDYSDPLLRGQGGHPAAHRGGARGGSEQKKHRAEWVFWGVHDASRFLKAGGGGTDIQARGRMGPREEKLKLIIQRLRRTCHLGNPPQPRVCYGQRAPPPPRIEIINRGVVCVVQPFSSRFSGHDVGDGWGAGGTGKFRPGCTGWARAAPWKCGAGGMELDAEAGGWGEWSGLGANGFETKVGVRVGSCRGPRGRERRGGAQDRLENPTQRPRDCFARSN